MTFSIITPTFNSARTIDDCLKSVTSQTHLAEHIIIDGASRDRTLEIVRRQSPNAIVVSEKDQGVYDAMNKGIRLASGEIVGILNSDDFYVGPGVLQKVETLFRQSGADTVFADLVYVRPGNLNKVVRYYSGCSFAPDKFAWGWMPPHPTLFIRHELYERYGLFSLQYKIGADFELAVRFLARHRVSYAYLPEVIVKMRTGGISTRNLRSTWILNREILKACAENGISTNMLKVYSKYFKKFTQIFARPS